MTKKKTTTAKAKAAEEVKTEKTQNVKKSTEDVASKDAAVAVNKSAGATISSSGSKDTSKEKEDLKSKENESSGVSFTEAEEMMNKGYLMALPEWEGFWFKSMNDLEKILVLTKDGEVLDTPHEEYKSRSDWKSVIPTEEQESILDKFWKAEKKSSKDAEDKEQKKSEESDKKANEEYNSLKAVAYNKSKNGSFIKLKSKISIEDLQKRTNLPVDASRTSEFAMSNGYVFDLEKSELTDKKSNI